MPDRSHILPLLPRKKNNCDIQIIGMSATLPNLDFLAKWLDAELFKTDFRPVPLLECVKVGKKVFNNELKFIREIQPPFEVANDQDDFIYLCLETIFEGHSVLVFCPTKRLCEISATAISMEIHRLGSGNPRSTVPKSVTQEIRKHFDASKLGEIQEQLRRCPAGLDDCLRRSINFGVAYHHAGLTLDERDIVEGAFKSGALKVLVATTTLSSGVNLPARCDISSSSIFCNNLNDLLF